MKVSENCYCNN